MVASPGPLTTVQDLGRPGGRRVGLAPGGAMDQRAYLWANRLLGNAPAAAALEVTLGGLTLRFGEQSVVALTGADCGAVLDRVPVDGWRTIAVSPGQELALGFSGSGMRAYVAFPGGLDVPSAFGSASAVLREGFPDLLGRALATDDALRWKDPRRSVPPRSVPFDQVPRAREPVDLPLIPGYEWDRFSVEDRERLFDAVWVVDPASDRAACRLTGPALGSGPKALDSTPLVDGTVQVTGDGAPLVFMRDRPTIGGYAKLGSVDPIALDALAQARPGAEVRFVAANPADVRRALVRRADFFGTR